MEAEQILAAESPFVLINGTDKYIDETIELCDERFGEGYIERSDYESWLKNPELLKIALCDGDYAGFSAFIPASVEEICEHMEMTEDEVLAITGGKPALIGKSAAVRVKYGRRVLMHRMMAAEIVEGRRLGYSAAFGSAWVYDNFVPAKKSFDTLGYKHLEQRRHLLWYGYEKYKCVACEGRCVCDAEIYYIKL